MSVNMPIAMRGPDPVGVANVSKGRSCNCVCLSCGLPVIARQGEQNQWHFAHEHSDDKIVCQFSLLSSARRFAKHVFTSIVELALPEFIDAPRSPAVPDFKLYDKTISLPATRIQPDLITRDGGIGEVSAPAVVTLHGVHLAVYFSPSFSETRLVTLWQQHGVSVLYIDVSKVPWDTLIDEQRFGEYLAVFAPREWAFHRKGAAMLEQAQAAADAEYREYCERRHGAAVSSVTPHTTPVPRPPVPERVVASEEDVQARIALLIASERRCLQEGGGSGRQCEACYLVSIDGDGVECPFCGGQQLNPVTVTAEKLMQAPSRYRCFDSPRRSANRFPHNELRTDVMTGSHSTTAT